LANQTSAGFSFSDGRVVDFRVLSLACAVRTGSIDLVEAHAASLLHARADAAQNAPASHITVICVIVFRKAVLTIDRFA
jgi:hypothetical protein